MRYQRRHHHGRRAVMPRHLKVAAAQMGPNNEGVSREEIVERMRELLDQAVHDGVELLVYPEMALTTYFPKKIRDDYDQFFETEVPPKALEPLLRRRRRRERGRPRGFLREGRRPLLQLGAPHRPRRAPLRHLPQDPPAGHQGARRLRPE